MDSFLDPISREKKKKQRKKERKETSPATAGDLVLLITFIICRNLDKPQLCLLFFKFLYYLQYYILLATAFEFFRNVWAILSFNDYAVLKLPDVL